MPDPRARKGTGPGDPSAPLYMIIDPETREAYRRGEGPGESGPLLFSSRDRLAGYVQEAGITRYEIIEVPGYVLTRLRGKPHWLDGEPHS